MFTRTRKSVIYDAIVPNIRAFHIRVLLYTYLAHHTMFSL